MAELTPQTRAADIPWSSQQTHSQFGAIAWLRWRILINSFRRKGGGGELAGRLVLGLTFAVIVVFFILGAGTAAYFFTSRSQLYRVSWLLWGIFILCQVLNIQLGQPGTTFDPTQLIRFPLRSNTYISIRLFFGLLSPANVAGTLMAFAAAIGIGAAQPSLWLYALLAMTVFAATNVLFSRMVFAWVDRWLSTRRAREVFTGITLAGFLGLQWANFTFNPAYGHHAHHTHAISSQRIHLAITLYHRAQPFLAVFPPELTTSSLLAANRSAAASYLAYTLACALFATAFFAVFALRMRTEFRGEDLSDAANGVSPKAATGSATSSATSYPDKLHSPASSAASSAASTPLAPVSSLSIPPVITTMLGKEFLYVRRHTGVLYGLVMPIFLVLIFASRFASRADSLWVFPAAVAYTLLSICPLSYNSFGLEASGSQLYFLAPVHMRDILLAKNLFNLLMALVEILAIFAVVSYMVGFPSPQTAIAALLWALGTLAINDVFANRRSLSAPKKINAQRMSKQASQLSTFISLGVLAVSSIVAAGLFELCLWSHQRWATVPLSALFAIVTIGIYLKSLDSLGQFALDHREELFAELCKQT